MIVVLMMPVLAGIAGVVFPVITGGPVTPQPMETEAVRQKSARFEAVDAVDILPWRSDRVILHQAREKCGMRKFFWLLASLALFLGGFIYLQPLQFGGFAGGAVRNTDHAGKAHAPQNG
jgi:hypothetical protein